MTTVQLPGGETIWYRTLGSGAPLLHIHGSAFGHRNFEKLTPHMIEHFEVIDFDLPGYGESIGESRPGGMEGLALESTNALYFHGIVGLARSIRSVRTSFPLG